MYRCSTSIFLGIGLFVAEIQECHGLRNPFKPNVTYLQNFPRFEQSTAHFCGTVQHGQAVWGFVKFNDNNIRAIKLGDKLSSYLIVSDITEKYLLITSTLSNNTIKIVKKTSCD